MTTQFQKQAGISLIVFTVLIVFTMVLHPSGGSFDYLLKIAGMIILSHSLALLSIPFGLAGFWGLTRRLGTDNFYSITAFIMVAFGMVAVMMAATMNGLVLPFFVQKYATATPEMIESLKPLVKYNSTVNMAFDDIYTGAFCLAICLWSVAILRTQQLPQWVAFVGMALALVGITLLVTGFAFNSMHGFHLFVTGLAVWIMIVGVWMVKGEK